MTEEVGDPCKAIDNLLERYEQERWKRKKDVDRVMVDYETGLVPLEEAVEKWDSLLSSFKSQIDDIISEEWQQGCRMLADLLACLLYTSPSPRDRTRSRMPSSA